MSIGRAIMATTEAEREMWVGIETCKMAASRQMVCQVSGQILDTRTVVVLELAHAGHTSMVALHGDAWDKAEAGMRKSCEEKGVTLTVTDGRALETARKAHERAKRAERARLKAESETPRP